MSLNLVVIFQPRGVVSKMQIHMLLNFFHKGTRMVFSIRILEAMQINNFPKDRTSPLSEKVTPPSQKPSKSSKSPDHDYKHQLAFHSDDNFCPSF